MASGTLERCSLHGWIPVFTVQGRMADSVYGVVWVSGLQMSTLWIEWPMVVVGLCYGQAYVKDNEHRCILLMAFWMHRDTVTKSWGPLLCHSSTTVTSCCSMIMHGPMLQGSVHNSWKLKTSHQQPDQLYVKEMCCTAWGKWWSHQIPTGFRTPLDHPNTVKLHKNKSVALFNLFSVFLNVNQWICKS